MVNLRSKIFVAGHKGLVGSAIIRKLREKGYSKIPKLEIFRTFKNVIFLSFK